MMKLCNTHQVGLRKVEEEEGSNGDDIALRRKGHDYPMKNEGAYYLVLF